MENKRKQLITWLNDAHAMEENIVNMLDGQLDDLQDMPEVREKIEEHRDVTKRQAEQVKDCIERLDGDVSGVKSTMASVMGSIGGAATSFASEDSVTKYAISDYATEHFEIASYKSLIAAAKELGENEIVATLEGILKEEEQMAKWLEGQIPQVTSQTLSEVS